MIRSTFHRLLHWQIGRLLALENPARVDADKAIHIDKVGALTNSSSRRPPRAQ